MIYQELWGAEYVQSEGLDPGVVDSQLPVDPRTFDAGKDAQIGGQPRWVWEREKGGKMTHEGKEAEMNTGEMLSLGKKTSKAKVISAAREPTLMCPCGKLQALEIE